MITEEEVASIYERTMANPVMRELVLDAVRRMREREERKMSDEVIERAYEALRNQIIIAGMAHPQISKDDLEILIDLAEEALAERAKQKSYAAKPADRTEPAKAEEPAKKTTATHTTKSEPKHDARHEPKHKLETKGRHK